MIINSNISFKIREYEELLTQTTGIKDIFILVADNNKLDIITQSRSIPIDKDDYIASLILESYHTQIIRNIVNVKKSFLYRKSIDNLIEENIQNLLIIPIVNKDKTLALIWMATKDNSEILLPKQNIINDIILLLSNPKEEKNIIEEQKNLNSRITILLADNNPLIIKFIQSSLKELDLNIIKVSSGKEAVEKFRMVKDISLIFIEEVMPNGIYGHKAIQEIRDIEKKNNLEPIIIIALTSDATKRTFEKLMESNVNRVLYKPIKCKEILEIVEYFGFKKYNKEDIK